jgi:hypothetical protein
MIVLPATVFRETTPAHALRHRLTRQRYTPATSASVSNSVD